MYVLSRARRRSPRGRRAAAFGLALLLSACGAAPGEKAVAGADAVKEAQEANAARLERIEKKLSALSGAGGGSAEKGAAESTPGGSEAGAKPDAHGAEAGHEAASGAGAAQGGETAHADWGYSGALGPDKWGGLSPEYGACGEGRAQSPVDIDTHKATAAELKAVEMDYPAGHAEATNTGHTVQISGPSGNKIESDGTAYTLTEFHFHTHSEHEFDGSLFPAEWQFVHKSADGKLVVVAVLVKAGKENKAFDAVLQHLPKAKGDKTDVGEIEVLDMLPAGRMAYRYDGSLTAPPCTEGVKWVVLVEPIEMSKAQIESLAKLFGDNNRPVQSLGDRAVVADDLKK